MPIPAPPPLPSLDAVLTELVAVEVEQDALRRRIRRLRADVDALIAAGG